MSSDSLHNSVAEIHADINRCQPSVKTLAQSGPVIQPLPSKALQSWCTMLSLTVIKITEPVCYHIWCCIWPRAWFAEYWPICATGGPAMGVQRNSFGE